MRLQLGKFSSLGTTSSLWALSVLQASRDPVFMALVDRMAHSPLDTVEPLQLLQLFQVRRGVARAAQPLRTGALAKRAKHTTHPCLPVPRVTHGINQRLRHDGRSDSKRTCCFVAETARRLPGFMKRKVCVHGFTP